MPILTLSGEYADAGTRFHTMRRSRTRVRNQVFAGISHHLPEETFEAIGQFWHGLKRRSRTKEEVTCPGLS